MAPTWLTVIAWFYVGVCIICAAVIVYDIVVSRRRHSTGVMNWVFPITAVYFGPFALAFYWRWARAEPRPAASPSPATTPTSAPVAHMAMAGALGAGGLGPSPEGAAAPDRGNEAPAFQYFAIAPMPGLGVRDGLKAAAKADIISLTFFEMGLFAWMALMTFVFFPGPNHLMRDSIAFWFLMQIGMIIGYFTSWPANVWLVKRGIKVPM